MTNQRLGAWWREPTKGQWISFAAAWLGWVLDAFDFTIYVLLLDQIAKEFDVTLTVAAGSITLTLLLRLLGGFAAGAAADRWGRKLPLMISMVWFAVCDGAIAFAPSFAWVLFFRTLFGFGMGAEWTSGTTLAMENWPARSRGIASGVLQGSWAIGFLLAAEVSKHVVPHFGWRAMFLIAALPALLVLPIRYLVPESPHLADKANRPPVAPLRTLLTGENLPRLIWASLAMLFGLAEYYGLTSLYRVLLTRDLGYSLGDAFTHVTLFNVGMLAGAVVCGLAAAKFGPIKAVVVPATIMIALLPIYTGMTAISTFAGALVGGIFGAGFSGVTPLLLTSIFPAEIRARCVGIAYHVGAFGAAFIAPMVPWLTERHGLSLAWSISVVVGASLAAMVVVLLLRPSGMFSQRSSS